MAQQHNHSNMFNNKELQLIKWGKENGKSQKEVEEALIRLRTNRPIQQTTVPAEEKRGIGSGFVDYAKQIGGLGSQEEQRGEAIGKDILYGAERVQTGIDKIKSGNIVGVEGGVTDVVRGFAEPAVRTAGNVAGGIFDIIGALTPGPVKKAIGDTFTNFINLQNKAGGISMDDIQGVINSIATTAKKHPEAAKDAEAILNIVGLLSLPKLGEQLGKTSAEIVQKGKDIGGGISGGVSGAVQKGKELIKTTTQKAKELAESSELSRIPSRIATNAAEKQTINAAIKELPGTVAQNAARDGVNISDVKFLYQLPKTQKSQLKQLADTVKAFAKGETKTNPIEVVGKPVVERISVLNSAKAKIGKKLGEVAKDLGVVTKEEVEAPVFNALKKVPGLDGLTVKNGILNFKNTVLTTKETLADRKAIQSIFAQATKWGNGAAKHRLRQELFEILGGKTKSLQNITGTQEKAFKAIRQGLADVLDAKNDAYKALNLEFAKVAQPLQDLQRLMKNVSGADDDILSMSAGLLARRLTSNAASNPQIRNILRALDDATAVAGKTQISIEVLQDFYNILDKYYDIAGKTGFQGQIKTALDSTNISGAVLSKLKGLAGETPAVRQKAIEDILREVLR